MSNSYSKGHEINSAAVARDVIATVARGEKVIFSHIIKRHGYSEGTAHIPKSVTKRYGYVKETERVIKALWRERERAIKLLKSKVSSAEYNDLINGIDKFTKNILLLQGKPTETFGFTSLQDMFAKEEETPLVATETEYREITPQQIESSKQE